MSEARFIVGDSLTVLRTLPDSSVDMIMTSPPFLALRSYLPADHPDKALEMGSEATPGDFLDALLDVVEECRRVLAPHGSICFELGDTYSGSGGAGGDYNEGGLHADQPKFTGSAMSYRKTAQRNRSLTGWPLEKSLCLIPELFRFALAYGFNPLTGRTIQPWRIRNVVRWHRPNPPVGALADKFRPATSDLVIACTSRSRYFDLDAVRNSPNDRTDKDPGGRAPKMNPGEEPYEPILAMCPLRVCTTCGKPSERITETVSVSGGRYVDSTKTGGTREPGTGDRGGSSFDPLSVTTLGWTDCGHNTWRTGIVLDPFGGSGTTGAVAVGHGRDAILIDLDERNAWLARERIGMFLTIEQPEAAA